MKRIIAISFTIMAFFTGTFFAGGGDTVAISNLEKQETQLVETIHIYGTGYGLPFLHNPETLIKVYSLPDTIFLDSAVSNIDGSYSLDILVNNVPSVDKVKFGVAPNPFVESANVSFYSSGENYDVRIFNEQGQLIFNDYLVVGEGNYALNVSGLGPGFKILSMASSNGEVNNVKLVQSSNYFNPSVSLSGDFKNVNAVKSMSVNELLLVYSSPGHEDFVVVEPVQSSINVDYVLNLIPDTLSTTISTTFTNNMFGYLMQGVNSVYKNGETGVVLGNGVSNTQGVDEIIFDYLTWTYGSDFLSSVNSVERTSTIANHSPNVAVLPNQNASYDVTLSQIPTQETANVQGIVVNNNSVPVSGAGVDIKDGSTTYAQTSTSSNGSFETTMPYTAYVNAMNSSEVITNPETVYAYVTKEEHNPATTNPEQVAPTINFGTITLEQITQDFSFTFAGLYTADNEHVNDVVAGNLTLTFKNTSTNEVQTIEQTGTNPVSVTMNGTPSDAIQITTSHPELADLLVIQHTNKLWYENNVAQNRPTYEWVHGQPYDTLTTTLGNLANPDWNQNLELYAFEYHHTKTNGDPITFNDDMAYMLFARGPAGGLIKKRTDEHMPNPALPALEVFIWTYDFGTGVPISNDKLQEMFDINNNIVSRTFTPTGRDLLPTVTHLVYDMSQPEVLAAQSRNWLYTTSTFRQFGTPNNFINLNPQTLCIDDSYSRYNIGATIPVIQSEQFEAFIGNADPTWGGTTSIITYTSPDGVDLNKAGRYLLRTNLLLDKGTFLLPANMMNSIDFVETPEEYVSFQEVLDNATHTASPGN